MKGHYREEGGIPTPTPTPTPYTLGGCSMVKGGEESEGTLQRRRRRKKKEKGERRRANLSRRWGKGKENSGKR